MVTIQNMIETKEIQDVLKYLQQHPRGFMNDLDKLNAENIVKELLNKVMLKTKETRKGTKYSMTKFGRHCCYIVLQKTR